MSRMSPLRFVLAASASLAAVLATAQLGRYSSMEMASVMLLGGQKIQAELKLSKSQQDTISRSFSNYADEADKILRQYRRDRQNKDKYNRLLRGQQEKLIGICLTALSATQTKRLRELGIQHYGIFSAAETDVAKELGLSSTQVAQIAGFRKQAAKVMQDLSERRAAAIRAIPQPKDPNNKQQVEEYRKKAMAAANKNRDQDIRTIQATQKQMEGKAWAVLSASQKAAFEKLKGKPFQFN